MVIIAQEAKRSVGSCGRRQDPSVKRSKPARSMGQIKGDSTAAKSRRNCCKEGAC